MIDNFNKCCQCGALKKEEDFLTNYSYRTKIFQCKNCIQKNISKEPQIKNDFLSNNKTNLDQINVKNEKDKKLDLKEPIIKIKEMNFLKKKKRRISKNIVFKRAKKKKIKDEFTSIIYRIIEQSNEQLLINYKDKDNAQILGLNTICNLCKKIKLSKLIKLSSLNEFKDLFDTIYTILEQEENSKKLIQTFQNKYDQIIQNKKDINKIQINDINKEILLLKVPQYYCFECISNCLIKNNGINILWEILQKEDAKIIQKTNINKNFEIISGLKDIQTNSSKNNINFSKNNIIEDKKDKNDNNDNNDILDNDISKMFNDKKLNIFDLILGDEENDNNENDFDNNSDENKSIKNDNKQLNDRKLKKYKKGKIKERKITFKKIIVPNNIQLNKNIINNNINNNIKEENDKNLSNINNANNMTQFKDLKYNNQKILDNNQPLFYNINNNTNNNYLKSNMTNNNFYNNNMSKLGEDIVYNRLVNQISFLKNKLCLISNLNRTRKANNNNININSPILISTNNFIENLLNFKTSMDVILNYMDNIGEILDKLSSINENTLSLMDSIFKDKINSNNLVHLETNSNYFSQLLNYNYNMQRMNGELCEIINKQLNILYM